jgi:UDP-N-acetylmuramate dehydrogenase
MIFSDYGFPGLVIKNETSNISFLADKSQVIVDSGLSAYILALQTANRDLSGLENIASATGSIGSVLYSNYTSSEINLVNELKKITVLNARSEILTYKGSWLFSSKSVRGRLKDAKKNNFSINPNNQEKLIKSNKDMVILTAIFQLRRSRQDDIMRKINELMPNKGKNIYPNTGNLFYDTTDESAARLILRSGAYRLKVGEIAVNPVNHNQLINKKSGQANDARQLIEDIKKVVFDKTNISLVEAIEFLGVW